MLAEQLCVRRIELGNKTHKSVVYDSRPEWFQKLLPGSFEKLRYDLLNELYTQSCALLTILVPSVHICIVLRMPILCYSRWEHSTCVSSAY